MSVFVHATDVLTGVRLFAVLALKGPFPCVNSLMPGHMLFAMKCFAAIAAGVSSCPRVIGFVRPVLCELCEVFSARLAKYVKWDAAVWCFEVHLMGWTQRQRKFSTTGGFNRVCFTSTTTTANWQIQAYVRRSFNFSSVQNWNFWVVYSMSNFSKFTIHSRNWGVKECVRGILRYNSSNTWLTIKGKLLHRS